MAVDTLSRIRLPKDRFLVKRVETPSESDGGILIPELAQKRIPHGKVVIAGKHEDLGVSIEVGDTLVFATYSGGAAEVDGEKYLIMKPEDILLVLKK